MTRSIYQPLTLPDVPTAMGEVARWNGLSGAALSLATVSVRETTGQPVLLITASSQSAEQSLEEIRFFAGERFVVARFPDWETLIYDAFRRIKTSSPNVSLFSGPPKRTALTY